MEVKTKFYINIDEKGIRYWFCVLRRNGLTMYDYKEAYVVDSFGHITNQMYEIHCSSSLEDYEKLKAKYPFGIIV